MRKILKDVFGAKLTEGATWDGYLEYPVIESAGNISVPESLIPFDKLNRSKNHKEVVHFYIDDSKFESVWSKPAFYLASLKRFPAVITTDFSLYRDAPLAQQIWNTYRNRVLGHFFQRNGISIIPNVRWGDERSYSERAIYEKFAFLGLPKHSMVSIGSYGCIKTKEDKYYFEHGLEAMLGALEPAVVLVYGAMPQSVFARFQNQTEFVSYPNWISQQKGGKHHG